MRGPSFWAHSRSPAKSMRSILRLVSVDKHTPRQSVAGAAMRFRTKCQPLAPIARKGLWMFLLAVASGMNFANSPALPDKPAVAKSQKALVFTPNNPILQGADPHVLTVGNTVWIYPTWSQRGMQQFYAFSSTNLVDWERHGPVLDFANVNWIKDDGAKIHYPWAPSVFTTNGQFYFYYSVGPQNPTPARLGVAVSDSPAGPFRDSGQPLLSGGNGFEAIDPMVFRDPKSGRILLYAGGSAGATLRTYELNPDLVSIAREISVATPKKFTEAPFIHLHEGIYYLSYSHGVWRESSYSIHYSTSDSPTGPWIYRGAILTSDATRKGPGHHSFLRDSRTGEWLIFYHRWENQEGDGPYRGSRQICVERVAYDAEGLIRPITMTSGSSATD